MTERADVGAADADAPTGRIRRLGRLGRFGAGSSARLAAARVRTLGAGDERRADVLDATHRRLAEDMKLVLGTMRGTATKLGQIASFVDTNFLPPEYTALYQEVLAELRDATPPMPYSTVAEVFAGDHGGPPEAVFATFDPTPIAAASIGQVHRATLFDATPVVVKVQYPGVGDAIRADLKNLRAMAFLVPLLFPGLDSGPLLDETERALLAELDYVAEAAAQQRYAELYREHPFVRIPAPVLELCGPRTLVAEDLGGHDFAWACAQPDAVRDRYAEIIFRYAYGTLYRFGFFNADAHPGNYAFGDDGSVVFYDYGAVKTIGPDDWANFVVLARDLLHGDPATLHADCVASGFVRRGDTVDPDALAEWLRNFAGELIVQPGRRQVTDAMVADVVASVVDRGSEWHQLTKRLNVDPEALLIGRLQIGLLAVFAKLRATADWHAIAREWVDDAPSATSLGAADAAFFAARGGAA